MAQIGSLFASLTLQNASFDSGIKRSTRNVQQAEREMAGSFGGMVKSSDSAFKKMASAAAGLGVAAGLTGLLTKVGEVNTEYQKLQGMLFTATGSQAAANKQMAELQKFAASTPFALDQVTEAYIKLKNLGLDPSMAALKSYGNTASAMGKPVMQFIEAIADASTGEFERLKEFGIKSSKEGEKVKFTFQGVTTEVKNTGKEIQGYLKKIGDTQFAGAMDRQAETLGGALSNLGDTWAQMAIKFGEAGFAPALENAVRGLTASAGSVENLATKLGFLTGQVIGTAVNGFVLLSQNIDTLTTAFEVVSAVIVGRFAVAMGTTALTAVRSFMVANTAAIAGMMAYARVAPVIGTATMAMSGLGVAARGVLALFGGPVGAAIALATGGIMLLATKSSEADNAITKLGATNQDAANLLQTYQDQAVRTVAAQEALGAGTDGLTSRMAKGTGEADRFRAALEKLGVTAQWAAFQTARAMQTKALSEYNTAKADAEAANLRAGSAGMGHTGEAARGQAYDARAREKARERALRESTATLRASTKGLRDALNPVVTPVAKPPTATATRSGKKGGSSSAGQDPLKAARDLVEQLKFEEAQLGRINEEQAVYNNLKQAGVTIESEWGKKIADATRKNQNAEAIKKNKDALDEQLKSLTQQTDEVGLNDRALALLNLQREHAERITKGLTDGEEDYYKKLVAGTNALYDRREAQAVVDKFFENTEQKQVDATERSRRDTEQLGRDLAGIGIRAFDDLIHGAQSFGDAFKGILTDLGDLMLEQLVYRPLAEMGASLLGGIASNLMGSLGIAIPGLGTGGKPAAVGKARGGPVQGGHEYWVGEHGPERFVAPTNGRIIPHDAPRGGNISINIDARGSTNEAAVQALVIQGIAQAMPQIKDAAYSHTMQKAGRLKM